MIDLPFERNLIISIAAVSLALALLTFIVLILNRIFRVIKRIALKKIDHISISQTVFRFIVTILWITSSAAVLFLAAFVQSFQNFTKEELVAEVRCRPIEDGTRAMLFEMTPIVNNKKQEPVGFILTGDQWALEGDILKWDNWLNFAGLHTMYKLTRVRGRYVNSFDEVNQQPSVYSLVEKEEDPRWRWLYKYGYRLRFVDAVYGNTVFNYPSEDNMFQVFVTTSGFSIQIKENRLSKGCFTKMSKSQKPNVKTWILVSGI